MQFLHEEVLRGVDVVEHPTYIYGLYRELRFKTPEFNNQEKVDSAADVNAPEHLTACNQRVLLDTIIEVQPTTILEIGVHRPRREKDESTTTVILKYVPQTATYIGIDMTNRKIEKIRADALQIVRRSEEQQAIRQELKDLGISSLDLLVIDGYKIPRMTYNDWSYCDLLRVGGAVVMHDTNIHSGPVLLWDSIDTDVFSRERFCVSDKDYGIGVFRRLK